MKGLLRFITCGSVDDGKSTLIGHILYDSKLLYTDQEQALRLDSRVGSRNGEIDYSLLLDGLMAEREQGITIDVAYRYFTTDKRSFIVADTPGHEEYTRNMAVGASFAELAVILVDASQGVLVQTRRHARICSLMGIRYFVFAVNKMDLVNFSEERFEEISRQIAELTEELSLSNTTVIPLSATDGDNVTTLSQRTPWYKGTSLLEYLEEVEISPENAGKGFYMPVQRVSRPDRTFRGSQGQIEAGSVSVGDEVRVLPSGETASVKTILAAGKETETAFAGQPVTIVLDREVDVSRGCVIEKESGLAPYRELSVSLLWMDDAPLSPGKEYLIKLGTKQIPGVLTKICYAVDINTGKHIPAESLSKNGIALCEIVLSEAITADTFALHRTMGELILIDRVSHATSACGVVQALSGQARTGNAASFVYGGVSARGDVFEEFFYDTETLSVFRYQPVTSTYTVGDTIPVKGESYRYPDSFDVIVLRDRAAVKVRDRVVEAVLPLEEYEFTGLPLVNGRGFEIFADSPETFRRFLTEYDDAGDRERPEFFRKWVRFDTYRKVVIR